MSKFTRCPIEPPRTNPVLGCVKGFLGPRSLLARRPSSPLARGKASLAVDEKWIKPNYEQINEKWSPAKQVVTQS